MKTLVYETTVESRAALRRRVFAAAQHIRNHSHISSAIESLLVRAENCIQLQEDTLNKYSKPGTVFKLVMYTEA